MASRNKTGGMRTNSLMSRPSLGSRTSAGSRPKQFYCTVFGQMDRSQTNLAVVLRTYFYPKEMMVGVNKHVEERWDDNPSFKIICNHEVNSDPPSVMLCNPVSVKAKPGSQFRIDLLNQEAFLDTAEFFTDGPQLPKCLQFDISLESYNITSSPDDAGTAAGALDHIPAIKIIRSPDEAQVASIPLVHLCDIPDAAMTGSFAFDDFCYATDPKPRFGTKCEHNRTWHRLPQLLVKFITGDRGLASKVMDIAKEWENHAGLQLIHVPQDSDRDSQIRVKFASRNQSAVGTDAEDIPEDTATMHLNVARDTHPVLFRRRVLHQFGHALGLYHEFEALPEEVEWDEAGVQLDTSMEAGWTTDQTKKQVFYKHSCSNNDNFDRLSIMTQTFKRSYVKGWLPRQHQSVLSVDDKTLVKHLYPPPTSTHQWADPLASPEPEEEEDESEEEDEENEEEMTEWQKKAMKLEREDMTPVDMFSGVFHDKDEITASAGRQFSDSEQPSTPPASVDMNGKGRKKRAEHKFSMEFEPTESGKKRVSATQSQASRLFEFEPTESGKKSIRPGTDGRSFIEHQESKYTKEEIDRDIRDGDFFSFRDQAVLRELEMPVNDRLPTPMWSPPDTPDSIPDSLAASPVSKLFLTDTFLDFQEDWMNVNQETMINLTAESLPGTRRQKIALHPGDIRFADGGEYLEKDFKGQKVQADTYGFMHQEKDLFGERTNVVSPSGLVEREQFYRTLGHLATDDKREEEEVVTFSEKMTKIRNEKSKAEEFYEPTREYVSEQDIQGMGFEKREVKLRRRAEDQYEGRFKGVEYEPGQKPKGKGMRKQQEQHTRTEVEYEPGQKGKGKGKKMKKQGLRTVEENDETFYNRSFRKAQQQEIQESEDSNMSFKDKLKNRDYKIAPLNTGLAEMQPADEDIFDLLDRASKETHSLGRGKFASSSNAPALISTKGSFAGTHGGSGSFRELGWASYYDYDEEDMMDYEYKEHKEEADMDLVSFRDRLQKRSGVAIHHGIEVTPAAADSRNYLESPVPVANRSYETEEKIKNKMLKHKVGRDYDDGIDMVSPNELLAEALDRGFGEKKQQKKKSAGKEGKDFDECFDEIDTEKKEAARRYYGMNQSPEEDEEDDVTRTKQKIRAEREDRQRSGKDKSDKAASSDREMKQSRGSVQSTSRSQNGKGSSAQSAHSQEERQRYGFDHTQTVKREDADSKKTKGQGTSPESGVSVEADLNWNLDRSHVRTAKSKQSASAMFDDQQCDDESPFLPPISPKKKQQPTSKSFVVSKEMSTQITADALVPQKAMGDYWVNKDTILDRSDPYADIALRMPTQTSVASQQQQRQRFYSEDDRPATYRSTFTAYDPPAETYERPKFESVMTGMMDEGDDQADVYSRLSDAKAYKRQGEAVDVWAQKTDISFTVLLYLKKNIGINWKRAGQYLGVSRERLRRIEDIGIASKGSGIEKMAQDMLFEWAEKDPQPTVAKLCAALEAADLSRLAQGVHEKVQKENAKLGPQKKAKGRKGRKKVDQSVKVPVSEETIPYRVMVYLKDNLGESWKDLAVCLKVPSVRIKGIEADAWQVEKMAYDMLHEWRQREKEGATVDRLIDALDRAQCRKLVKGVQARCQSYHFKTST